MTLSKFVALDPDEREIRSGAANHRRGPEAVGGRLYLTSTRLIFVPHSANVQVSVQSFLVADIADIAVEGVIKNTLVLKTTGGIDEKFIALRASKWVEAIKEVAAG